MHRIIQSSLIGMDMPGGDVERNAIQSALDEQGREQMFNFMKPQWKEENKKFLPSKVIVEVEFTTKFHAQYSKFVFMDC